MKWFYAFSMQHLMHSQHSQQQIHASKAHNPQHIPAFSSSFNLLPVSIRSGVGWKGGSIVNELFATDVMLHEKKNWKLCYN